MPKFTIFTPTFNRAHTLHRPFLSLMAQSYKDFEWLVIDDGSTDQTENLLNEMKQKATFSCRIIAQGNCGKHVAFNRGVREARGELFVNLDSDDELLPDALENMLSIWTTLNQNLHLELIGVTGLCVDQTGKIVGGAFPSDKMIMSSKELYFRFGDLGEKFGFQRTEVLKKYPFPESPGIKFVAEGFVWFQISESYKTLFVNTPFRRYHRNTNDLEALSVVNDFADVAASRVDFYRCVLESESSLIKFSVLRYFKAAVSFWRCQIHLNTHKYPRLKSFLGLALVIAGLPIGFLLYAYDQTRKIRK